MGQTKTINKFSKSQLRKLGKELCKEDFDHSKLDILEEYRLSYKESGREVFDSLILLSNQISSNSITTYRIKRINSIIRKLKRRRDRPLGNMNDIVGCRCIVKSEKQIKKLRRLIKNQFTIDEENDYYLEPNSSGYKSLHLYVVSNLDSSKIIEIQIRVEEDHNWATLVEIIDNVYDVDIKETLNTDTKEYKELKKFHQLLAKSKKLTLEDKTLLVDLIIKYDIFNELRSIFMENYLNVRKQFNKLSRFRSDYYIIESGLDYKPQIFKFPDFDSAEKDYYNRYKTQDNDNFVLINISNSSLENLEKAYSNYILTTHNFLEDYLDIVGDLVVKAISESRYRVFKKYYSIYLSSILAIEIDSQTEAQEIQKTDANEYNIKYWVKEFLRLYGNKNAKIKRIKKNIDNEFNKIQTSKWRYRWIINSIHQKYGYQKVPKGW
jgi:ppGpp synthetase/RelA/SpoT-type nucleotidyltranferase